MGITYEQISKGLDRVLEPFFRKRAEKNIKMIKEWDEVAQEIIMSDFMNLVLFAEDDDCYYFIFDCHGVGESKIVIYTMYKRLELIEQGMSEETFGF